MDDIIRPKNMVAKAQAEQKASADATEQKQQEELMMKAYADYLDDLKEKSPKEYKKVVDDMMAAAKGGNLDGLKTPAGLIGKDGKSKDTDAIPSREITPKPGFVVKTKKLNGSDQDSKVFINICTHKAIKNFSKRVQLMEDGTEQEGLSVPCSVGPPRGETDKAGKPAVVFDVIVNPQVVKDAKDDLTGSTRHWLIEIAMDRIDNKYSTQLDRRYKLPKARYKGKAAVQRIRTVEKPKIEAVTLDDGTSNPTKNRPTSKKSKPTKKKSLPLEYCKYTLSYSDTMSAATITTTSPGEETKDDRWSVCPVPGEGSLPNPCASDLDLDIIPAQLRLSIPVPRLATVRGLEGSAPTNKVPADRVDVQVSPWMVVVKAESYHAVEVLLPYPVFCEVGEDRAHTDTKQAPMGDGGNEGNEGKEGKEGNEGQGSFMDCVFDCETRTLHLILTVDTTALDFDPVPQQGEMTSNHVGPDPGSRPWLLSQAINDRSRPAAAPREEADDNAYDPRAVGDDDVFPEDAFHNMDAMSQHFNMQKAQGRKEKEDAQALKEAEQAKAEQAKEEQRQANLEAGIAVEEDEEEDDDDFAKALKKASKPIKKVAPTIDIDRKPVVGLALASEESEGGVCMENDLIFDLC
jgi:hypothetical protein